MDKEQEEKVYKAIDKMLPWDTTGNRLTRRLFKDGVSGWQISYKEDRNYFPTNAIAVRGFIEAIEIVTNKKESEEFGVSIKGGAQVLGDEILKMYDYEMDAAYIRLKERIK